ncbi:MAG: PKD domain-containing protein, partial [bacterium]|nr:PKD domain-containing protein [bacterium]
MQRSFRPWQRAISALIIISFLNLQIVPSILAKEDQNPPVNPAQVVDGIYPIALKKENIQNLSIGSIIENILNGYGPGNFGWLTWTGDRSEPILAKALIPPGTVDSYLNPFNNEDHALNCGDWVKGLTGVKTSAAVRAAIEQLKYKQILVPVWDEGKRVGDLSFYHIIGFAKVKIIDGDYKNGNGDSNKCIRAIYCGLIECENKNKPPVANAGPDQNVVTGVTVTLNGSTSSDPDQDPLTYKWTIQQQPQDSTATLSSTVAQKPTLITDKSGSYTIQLIVNDGKLNSPADTVVIVATVPNQPPVANAGPDQMVALPAYENISSKGVISADSIGAPLSKLNDGLYPPLPYTLSDPWVYPSPTPEWSDYAGTYNFCTEYDNISRWISCALSDNYLVNRVVLLPYVSTTGYPHYYPIDYEIQKSADGSTWESILTVNGNTNPVIDQSFPWVSAKFIRIYVTRACSDSGNPAIPGKFRLGATEFEVYGRAIGSNIVLDGNASSDPDGDPLTYQWSMVNVPAGSLSVLIDTETAHPTFFMDKKGNYEALLVVNDGKINSTPDTVIVTAIDRPPVANAGPNQEISFDITKLTWQKDPGIRIDTGEYAWVGASYPEIV